MNIFPLVPENQAQDSSPPWSCLRCKLGGVSRKRDIQSLLTRDYKSTRDLLTTEVVEEGGIFSREWERKGRWGRSGKKIE